jgi:hypothetical protein
MHLNVTFVHGAHVTSRQQRNPRYRGFLGNVAVEIAEADAAEAPVALRVTERGGEVREYRLRDGKLFLPAGGVADAAGLAAAASDGWRLSMRDTPLAVGHQETYGPGAKRISVDEVRGTLAEDPGVHRVNDSAREEREAEVRAAAAVLLLVDGALYAEASEPLYIHSDGWFAVQSADSRNYADRAYYRADERGAVADDFSSKKGAPLPPLPLIEVLVEGAVSAPMPHLALLEEAAILLDQMAGHGDAMKSWDVATFAAYAGLRDAAGAGRERVLAEGDAADLSDVLDAAGPVVEVRETSWRERGMPGWDEPRRGLARAADRYLAFRGDLPSISPTRA